LPASRRAFTLVETMIALSVGVLVLGAATGSLVFFARGTASVGNYQEMNMTGRWALETFASDSRMAADVLEATSARVSLEVYDADGGTETVVYAYHPETGAFTRAAGGKTAVLLEDLVSLDLAYFDHRHGVANAPLEIKEIQLRAVMRRKALSVGNTNEIISARYMMRNRGVNI
jgi:prepilin-type N-terminal cleavage/methylation domain-containing protein